MAWVFVRLKWRLLANAGVSGAQEALGWLMRAVGLLAALGGAADLASAPHHGDAGLVAVFVAVTVGWIMLPLLMGTDRSLSVALLASLPLTRRDLVVGLFAASLVGAPPLATLILLSGSVFAYAPGGAATLLVGADVLVMTVLAIASGRAVSAGLSAAVHSRRGRDLASVVLAIVSAGGYIAWRLSTRLAAEVGHLRPSRLTDALSWTPPGALARSMVEAHDGATAAATARLGYGLAAVVVIGWLWARALGRQLTNPASTASAARTRRATHRMRPRTGTPGAAVWLKDLRYLWRAPVQRANIITGVVVSGFIILPLVSAHRTSAALPFAGLAVGFFMQSNLSMNVFGVDSAAFAVYVLTGAEPAVVLRAKGLAVAAVVAAITALAVVAGAAVSGAWIELPSALLLGAGVILSIAGVGLVASVHSPYPVAMSTPTFGRARRPRGSGSGGVSFAALLIEMALIGMLVGLVALSRFALGIGTLPGAVVAALAGAVIASAGIAIAAGHLRTHLPEVLHALAPRA